MTERKKTLLVGLDAVCWDYLDPLLKSGELPTIQRLIDQGNSGVLMSTMPALTPIAWSSIITGKNPGKHGVFDMTRRLSNSYEFAPTSARSRTGQPFWRLLNERGVRVGLVNIPFIYPLQEMDGFAVAGFGAPGSVPDLTYPRDALDWMRARFGGYEPNVSVDLLRSGRYDDIFAGEREHQKIMVETAVNLSEKYQVDALAINLMLLDHMNHKMPDMARIQEAMRQLDVDLQRLIDKFQPDNIMAISDHGSRRVKGDFLLHAWLRDEGYSVQMKRSPKERDQALNFVLNQWFDDGRRHLLNNKITRLVIRGIASFLPDGMLQRFGRYLERSVPFAGENVMFSGELDFKKTRVYPGTSYAGLLYFNRNGREPEGIVTETEQDALAQEIIDKLTQLTDPETRRPLFGNIYRAQDIFEGTMVEAAPDLVIDFYESDWNILSTFHRGSYAEQVRHQYFVDNRKDFGHHSQDGIFIYSGQDFSAGLSGGTGNVMDIPAALLHLYDVPIPDDYDGRSLAELFTPEFLEKHPVRYQTAVEYQAEQDDTSYSEEEAEEIVNHLRALGYLD
ncbi:MAG: hypothetical protein GY803_02575 [Chloroflexi bacterium]|nr:hypothetical protein [Chloroflexota bacterium]